MLHNPPVERAVLDGLGEVVPAMASLPSDRRWCRYTHAGGRCKSRTGTLAGQLLEKIPSLAGVFVPRPSPAYLFSKPVNWLDFDPSYPKNPKTFGEHIRKSRMDKGLLIRELAEQLGVSEHAVINRKVISISIFLLNIKNA